MTVVEYAVCFHVGSKSQCLVCTTENDLVKHRSTGPAGPAAIAVPGDSTFINVELDQAGTACSAWSISVAVGSVHAS